MRTAVETLLLSEYFVPVRIVGWQEAFYLVCGGRAVIIEEYSNITVRSPQLEHKVPAVIRYKYGGYRSVNISRLTRNALYARDRGRCAYCGKPVSKLEMTKDHIIPKSRGGEDTWENVVLSCFACNNIKNNRTPSEAGMRLLVPPTRPKINTTLFKVPSQWKAYMVSV